MDIEDLNKEGNPYPHVEDRETQDVKGYFSSPITSENLLGEVEKNRANPRTVTITCEDERSMKFAEIAASIKVTPDKTHFNAPHLKSDILILSDGKIIGGEGYDLNMGLADIKTVLGYPGASLMAIGEGSEPKVVQVAVQNAPQNPLLDLSISPPSFMVGVVKKGYCTMEGIMISYVETTSFGVIHDFDMDRIVKSSPISPWAFDMLTEFISTTSYQYIEHNQYQEIWVLKTFIQNKIINRLRAKCEELVQAGFSIASLLKDDNDVFDLPLQSLFTDEQYEGGGEIIRLVENYVGGMNLLHAPPPEKWNISLKDVLVSQVVGDTLEGK